MTLRALSDLAEGLSLLTRLPMPAHSPRGAASAWSWPVVGAGIGAVSAGVCGAGLSAGMTPGLAAALAVMVQVILTGALHEDGLADSADGLFGGHNPARRLAIMKDSRVGSYGVLALLLVTLVRWTAIAALAGGGGLVPALIAAGALSRAPMAVVMAALPNARGAGFSHATGRPPLRTAGAAAAISVAIAAILCGGAGIAMAIAATGATLWLARSARLRIGGQTGDILGATQQLAEAAALATAAALI